MLEELSKYDSEWRDMAMKICHNKMTADDLVNDMYLKVINYKKINHAFVYKVLKNLFLNHIKKEARFTSARCENIKCRNINFEPDDNEKEILEAFEDQKWHRQELIQDKIDLSYRQIEDKYKYINYAFAFREVKIARENIFNQVNGKNNRPVQDGQKNQGVQTMES